MASYFPDADDEAAWGYGPYVTRTGGAVAAPARAARKAAPRLAAFAVAREALTAARAPLLRERFGLERLPLAPARVAAELTGCPTALANGIRRVLLDELPWHALAVPNLTPGLTTERHTLDQFVRLTVGMLPLRPLAPGEADGLTFELDAENLTAVAREVYAGELVPSRPLRVPLFNPTAVVATLQQGKRIVLKNVTVATGRGRAGGAFAAACLAASVPRDLAEHPREATHAPDGPARDESGFLESCLVSDPRHYVVVFSLPATGEDPGAARAVFAAACASLAARVRAAGAATESRTPGVWVSSTRPDGWVEGTLSLDGETTSVGELLRRYAFDLAAEEGGSGPRIWAAAKHVAHEDRLVLTVCAPGDAAGVVRAAAERAAADLDALAAAAPDAPTADLSALVPPDRPGPRPRAATGGAETARAPACVVREWQCGGRLRVGATGAPAGPDRGLGGVLAAAPGRWLARTEAAPGGGARLVTWAAGSADPADAAWSPADFAAGAAFDGLVGVFDAADGRGVDTPAPVVAAVYLRRGADGVDAVRIDT